MRHKSLTPEERHAEEAFALNTEITNDIKLRRAAFMRLIGNLARLLEIQGYKDLLGDEHAEWVAYLAQIEVYIPRSAVNRWLKIKDRVVDEWGIPMEDLLEIPETRVGDIASVAGSSDEAKGMLSLAKVLTAAEWKDEVHKKTGKHTREDGHLHDMKKYEICKVCGMKHAI